VLHHSRLLALLMMPAAAAEPYQSLNDRK
jgi:hypothetical protein